MGAASPWRDFSTVCTPSGRPGVEAGRLTPVRSHRQDPRFFKNFKDPNPKDPNPNPNANPNEVNPNPNANPNEANPKDGSLNPNGANPNPKGELTLVLVTVTLVWCSVGCTPGSRAPCLLKSSTILGPVARDKFPLFRGRS